MSFLTHGPAKRSGWTIAALSIALTGLATPAIATTDTVTVAGSETRTIIVRKINKVPATEAEARIVLRRLGNAALEVCGADTHSLAVVKAMVRHSHCWKQSMARAVAQVESPILLALFRRTPAGREA